MAENIGSMNERSGTVSISFSYDFSTGGPHEPADHQVVRGQPFSVYA